MNLNTLNEKLMEITKHEEDYKNGKENSSLSDFKTKNINNEDILYISLKDIIEYHCGSLISIKKHSRFQSFPKHCHDGIEINYMYSGSCRQHINDKVYELTKGQALLLDSETIHMIEPLNSDDILLNINIEKDFFTTNFFNRFSNDSILISFFLNSITNGVKHDNFLLFHSEDSERLKFYICELMCEWLDPSIVSKDIMESLITLIVSELVISYKNDFTNNTDRLGKTPIIPILRYIEKNYAKCTLNSTAKVFNLNPNYLSNLLKKHTHYSYRELIQIQKLKVSEQLLKTSNLSISEVANSAGYENVSFFYKKFKEHFHCLPGEYRTKYSKK